MTSGERGMKGGKEGIVIKDSKLISKISKGLCVEQG